MGYNLNYNNIQVHRMCKLYQLLYTLYMDLYINCIIRLLDIFQGNMMYKLLQLLYNDYMN